MADTTLSQGLNRAEANRKAKDAKLKELESLVPGITSKYKFGDEKNLDNYLARARLSPAGYTNVESKQDARLANFMRSLQKPVAKPVIKQNQPSPGSKSTAPTVEVPVVKDNRKGLGQAPQQVRNPTVNNDQAYIDSLASKGMTPEDMIRTKAVSPKNQTFMEFAASYNGRQPARVAPMQEAVQPSSKQPMSPEQVNAEATKLQNMDDAMLEFESAKNKAMMEQSWSGNEYDDRSQAEIDTQARYNQLAKSMPAADKYDYIRNSGLGEDAANAHIENVMNQEKAKVMSGLSKEDQAAFMQYLANK